MEIFFWTNLISCFSLALLPCRWHSNHSSAWISISKLLMSFIKLIWTSRKQDIYENVCRCRRLSLILRRRKFYTFQDFIMMVTKKDWLANRQKTKPEMMSFPRIWLLLYKICIKWKLALNFVNKTLIWFWWF